MSDFLNLNPKALCVAVHPFFQNECPICGALKDEACVDMETGDGEELPTYLAHIGRATGGESMTITETDNGQFKVVDN